MVEIPDDVARNAAYIIRAQGTNDWLADLLDPPKPPPPTLVEQMVEANANLLRTRGEAMTDVLAVVRAAVEELSVALVDDGTYLYRPDVLDLLGGGSDA